MKVIQPSNTCQLPLSPEREKELEKEKKFETLESELVRRIELAGTQGRATVAKIGIIMSMVSVGVAVGVRFISSFPAPVYFATSICIGISGRYFIAPCLRDLFKWIVLDKEKKKESVKEHVQVILKIVKEMKDLNINYSLLADTRVRALRVITYQEVFRKIDKLVSDYDSVDPQLRLQTHLSINESIYGKQDAIEKNQQRTQVYNRVHNTLNTVGVLPKELNEIVAQYV